MINFFKSIGVFHNTTKFSYLYDVLFFLDGQYFVIRGIYSYSFADVEVYEVNCIYFDSDLSHRDGIYQNNFFKFRFLEFVSILEKQIPDKYFNISENFKEVF